MKQTHIFSDAELKASEIGDMERMQTRHSTTE